MKIADARALKCGLYVVHWKDGSSSKAAVGMTHSGERWLAPTNWTAPTTDKRAWSLVDRVEPVQPSTRTRSAISL